MPGWKRFSMDKLMESMGADEITQEESSPSPKEGLDKEEERRWEENPEESESLRL